MSDNSHASVVGQRTKMDVILLGTGTPLMKENQWGPSTLIRAGKTLLLFDCGRGASLRLIQAGVPLEQVSKVFLTHLHSDHIVGLPDLWLNGWELGRSDPLWLWGPEGTTAMASHLAEAFSADIQGRQGPPEFLPGGGAEMEATEIREGFVLTEGDVKVTSFEVDHGSFKPALGFRVDYGGYSVVVSGDTRYSDNLIKFSHGADVLIHDAWVVDEGSDSPALQLVASPEEAGRVFDQVKPRLAVITHYNTTEGLTRKIRSSYKGKLLIGRDLTRIEVGSSVKVSNIKTL